MKVLPSISVRPPEITIRQEICAGCAACVPACRKGAITVVDYFGVLKIEPRKCTRCGDCVTVCPSGAIQIFELPDSRATRTRR